jgi:hypothetical protein
MSAAGSSTSEQAAGLSTSEQGRSRSIEVFFDYTCGFSNRARHWLDELDGVEVEWRPFSLLEQRCHDDGPPVFQRPDLADNVSLIALAGHEAVRAEGGDVAGYRGSSILRGK